ncbi:hypothetical protein [Teredinibacter sp. KSP-S5-2]|uniref:hypothetical protein n=1 Tax=Teredinibacter sp. KSP-S5-2 TaxID=3034506 RepID=UPI0029343E9E|nr:hypothetical protein [Teredinibacter sp. KSP-S5-2]WNO11290.1 hypothetical protein P5V12_08910 [Teredinibacter sp. KSP-S5-2]
MSTDLLDFNGSIENMFLGHAIKNDRKGLQMSQAELQLKVRDLSIKGDPRLSDKEKELLLGQTGNFVSVGREYVSASVSAKLVSNIERGVARAVTRKELELIAEVLGTDVEKYLALEVNPLNLIGKETPAESFVAPPSFERVIEFEPEFRQAGVSILSFFSELVESEFGGQSVKVGIMQNGNAVTLRVETPEGELLKEVEKTLNQYGLAVMGKAPIESVSSNPQLVQDLKTRLEVTSLELRLRKESHLEQSKHYEARISSLESQIAGLHELVGNNLIQHNNLTETIRNISGAYNPSESFLKALSVIESISSQEKSKSLEHDLETSLGILENESPGILSRLARTLEGIPAGIAVNLATPWVQSIITSMPK